MPQFRYSEHYYGKLYKSLRGYTMDKNIKMSTAILDGFDDCIYVMNQDLVIEYMNSAMIAEFGDGIGKKCHELINQTEEKCSWCQSDEVFEGKRISREVYVPLVDKTYYLTEIPFEKKDGTIAKLSIYRDVTESKKRQEMLSASEEGFTNLFEHVGCGVYMSSKEGKLLTANQALIDMMGYDSKTEFLAIDIAHDLHQRPEDRRKLQDLIEREGRVIDYEEVYKRKDGSLIPVLLTSHVRYDSAGNILGYEGIIVDQSHRIQMENRLKASQKDFKRLFENMPTGVFFSSKEGKFLNVNQAMLDMLGYKSKAEFLNIDIAKDLYVRPEDRQKFREMIEHKGRVIGYEVEFKRKDGSTIPIWFTGHTRYDQNGIVIGYEGMSVDISQRKLMERQLKEAHDFINKIIQSSPNAIMAADMEGNILIWNRAAEEILGYAATDVIDKMNIDRIYPDGMALKVMQLVRSPGYGGVGRLNVYPMVYLRQDGTVVEGNLSAALIYDANGKEIASVRSFVDLKERLEMERALRRTQEQLLQSEKLAAMGRLTSQIAHELNNPLYGIMNTLELLKTEISPQSKRHKVLEMALSETVRLSDLLRKMLSFSKSDQEEKQAVDLNTVLDEILLLHEKQLQENDIKIKTTFAKTFPQINASKNQLRQVFSNLVANACDAMPDGGTLTVTTAADPENVKIEIADTGIGIEEEHLKKIFDSFFTTKDSVKGVGLGLSVCYGFIKDHGGDIQVKSKVDSGTTFTITFPIFQESAEKKEAHTSKDKKKR
jgi:two-component system NtrC family sensor kinase